MTLQISPDVREKLATRHKVSEPEIEECFANRAGKFLDDTRQQHKTVPKTVWFVSETDRGRKLKVVFIQHQDGTVEIKSAFAPNSDEIYIYNRYGY